MSTSSKAALFFGCPVKIPEKLDPREICDSPDRTCAIGLADDYDNFFVYLKVSRTDVELGPPVPVITQEVTPDQIIELVKFCQLMKIGHGTFGWHLAAFYG